jgi:hypothetical protein
MVDQKGDAVVLDGKEYAVAAEGLPRWRRPSAAPAPVARPASGGA